MRPHLSLDVRNVPASVEFYRKVFGVAPQKQTDDYAKFDLTSPALNFSLVSSTGQVSAVDHLGIEVESVDEVAAWKTRLQEAGILNRVEENVACCFARQDKVWFSDPDGNAWEVFTVHEQLPVEGPLANTGCCIPKQDGRGAKTCATSSRSPAELPRLVAWVLGLGLSLFWSFVATVAAAEPVEFTAVDYGYQGTDRLQAGTVVVSLNNGGQELHHVQVVKIPEGKTAMDLREALKAHPEHLLEWAGYRGGPNAVLPGHRASATMVLTAGKYVLLCLIPDQQAVLHGVRGMMKAVRVVPAVAPVLVPASSATITQYEFGFRLSQPIKPGVQTIEVRNAGTQAHEVVLLKLNPGSKAKAVGMALEPGGAGIPPGAPVGGIVGIEPGARGFFTHDFQPGLYGLICFLADRTSTTPHYHRGMTLEFAVQ